MKKGVLNFIFTVVCVAVFAAFVAMGLYGADIRMMFVQGVTVFIVGVITQIIAGKKDDTKTLAIAIMMVAIGGTAMLISILFHIGFFNSLM